MSDHLPKADVNNGLATHIIGPLVSRVKKIISQDSDIHMCSNNAAFMITCAAVSLVLICVKAGSLTIPILLQEIFIQHLADEAHTQAKLERKPRRNVQYKDVG